MKKIISAAVIILLMIASVSLRAQTAPCYLSIGIPFAWDSLTSPTVLTLNDDQFSQAINIGFPFCFFGTYYSQLLIGSNAVISFNLTMAGGYNTWPISATLPS